jgi:hypothetical protein
MKIECPDSKYYFNLIFKADQNIVAIVEPVYKIDLESMNPKPGCIGTITFRDVNDMRTGVIAHESLHLATTYMRIVLKKIPELGSEIDIVEEDLATFTQHFATSLGNIYWRLRGSDNIN